MNAIIGLCHFCEAHGPRPLFCTFTTDEEQHTKESSRCPVECSGCTSLGPDTVLLTKDDNGIIYCSRESVPNDDITAFLRQAALRSITCEVSWDKDSGIVYFSETQGHVLSHMFHLKDTRARGLKRLFSIVVLMKDKMFLLNITPVLSDYMKKIAKELQQLAESVYNNEQSICSQRALRLKTGRHEFGQSRPLMQLTNENDIFKKLHSHFTWILKTGALIYSETLCTSQELLNKLHPETTRGSIFEDTCLAANDVKMTVRELAYVLTQDVFLKVLYCLLTGIKVMITPQNHSMGISETLKSLLPNRNVPLEMCESNCQSTHICVLEERDNIFDCKWNKLPIKNPTLMNKIVSAISNDKFNDAVLAQHLKSLQLEWLGIAKTVKSSIQASGPKADAVAKLKKILGVSQHDESLVNYWMETFCD